MKLFIGNKNYSSWSMRPWVLMRQTGIAFEEVMLRFDGFEAQSQFKQGLHNITPVGKVPVLLDADLAIWDTLALYGPAQRMPYEHRCPFAPHRRFGSA